MGLRLFYPQALGIWYKTRDDLIILRPNFKGVARGVETVQEIQTNSFGMRDREHRVGTNKEVLRIMLLGDSHMEALQVKFEQSFAKLLEVKLNALSGRRVEVINAAVSGWGTDEQVTWLSRYGKAFKPNVILLAMTLHNDISDNLEQHFHTFVDGKLRAKPTRIIPSVEYKYWQVKALLGAHLHSYQLFTRWWHYEEVEEDGRQLNNHVLNLIRKGAPKRIHEGWEMTQQLLSKLKGEATGIRAQLAVFLIPLSIQLDKEKLYGLLNDRNIPTDDIDIDKPQRIMRKFGNQESIEVIDLLSGFREWEKKQGKSLFLKYDGHWTENGHNLASTIVSQVLIEKRIIDSQTDHIGTRIQSARKVTSTDYSKQLAW
jgi:hypothetical protein